MAFFNGPDCNSPVCATQGIAWLKDQIHGKPKNSALEPAAKPGVVAEQPRTAPCGNPPFITEFKSSCAPRHAAHTPRHAARSRSIQKITAERFKPGVTGLRDWRAQ